MFEYKIKKCFDSIFDNELYNQKGFLEGLEIKTQPEKGLR